MIVRFDFILANGLTSTSLLDRDYLKRIRIGRKQGRKEGRRGRPDDPSQSNNKKEGQHKNKIIENHNTTTNAADVATPNTKHH
jgi:hypothetical protein